MAYHIRVSPDQLHQRANQYKVQAEKLEEVVAQLDNLLSQLRGEWEGAAADAFAASYEEIRAGFQEAVELAHEIASALDSTAQAFEEMDQQLAQALKYRASRPVIAVMDKIPKITLRYLSFGGK